MRFEQLQDYGFIHEGDIVDVGVVFSSWVVSSLFSCVSWVQEGGLTRNEEPTEKLKDNVEELGNTLNEFSTVQDASAGILDPIYRAAEFMAFPSFYWIAFALMVAGVVCFAGQLVFTKLFLLFKMNLNIKEVFGDALGLLISLVGLVLTTQAATQNSGFPENSIAVVSSTAVGAILGLVFYWWGAKAGISSGPKHRHTGRELTVASPIFLSNAWKREWVLRLRRGTQIFFHSKLKTIFSLEPKIEICGISEICGSLKNWNRDKTGIGTEVKFVV